MQQNGFEPAVLDREACSWLEVIHHLAGLSFRTISKNRNLEESFAKEPSNQ